MSKDYELSIAIQASGERVWDVLMDVERWPEWTPSMTAVERLDKAALAVGSRVRIKQPRMPATIWEVFELEPGQSFSWRARGSGLVTTAVHRLAPAPAGGTTVTLGIRQTGALAWIIRLLAGRVTRRYVRMEAEGLKRRSQSA